MILTWDAPAEDAESVTGYRIRRRAPDKGQRNLRVLVEDTGSAETTYIDTTTKNGVRYVYRVHALRGEVVSAESNFAERRYVNPATATPTPTATATATYTPPYAYRYGYTYPNCHGYIYTHRYADAHTNARV